MLCSCCVCTFHIRPFLCLNLVPFVSSYADTQRVSRFLVYGSFLIPIDVCVFSPLHVLCMGRMMDSLTRKFKNPNLCMHRNLLFETPIVLASRVLGAEINTN